MIRTALTAVAIAIAALAAPAQAGPATRALCILSRHDDSIPTEEFSCDFIQNMGAAYIDSPRWVFTFPHSEQNKTFTRQNTEDFIRWTRAGQYTLTLFQSGQKPYEKK